MSNICYLLTMCCDRRYLWKISAFIRLYFITWKFQFGVYEMKIRFFSFSFIVPLFSFHFFFFIVCLSFFLFLFVYSWRNFIECNEWVLLYWKRLLAISTVLKKETYFMYSGPLTGDREEKTPRARGISSEREGPG